MPTDADRVPVRAARALSFLLLTGSAVAQADWPKALPDGRLGGAGVSNTNLGGLPLPFDLSVLGMNGCTLYTSLDVTLPMTNLFGRARATVPIPLGRQPGLRFYNQAIVVDPGANAAGLVLSNAGAGVDGQR